MQFIPYLKTPQFSDVHKIVSKECKTSWVDGQPLTDMSKRLPVLQAVGSVKLHGTNAGIRSDGKDIWFQSRNNIINLLKDNAGFAHFMESRRDWVEGFVHNLRNIYSLDEGDILCIDGEFAGKGIFDTVAIGNVEKSFFIFSISANGVEIDIANFTFAPSNRIYNIAQFGLYDFTIDFNDPQSFIDQVKAEVDKIDAECPVGKALGHIGHGEGLVLKVKGYKYPLIFKVKGESHSKSKVKTIKNIVAKDTTVIDSLVTKLLTESRLDQFWHLTVDTINGGEPNRSMIGTFIKNISTDIIAECKDDLLDANMEYKEIGGEVAFRCRIYFIERMSAELL